MYIRAHELLLAFCRMALWEGLLIVHGASAVTRAEDALNHFL